MQHDAVLDLIEGMARELQQHLTTTGVTDPCMVGIHTGGVWVAERLHRLLELPDPLGTLDISFYRDDLTRVGMHPQVKPSKIPFDVEGRHLVLVDDVLHTGRTVRAALNELFDYGRPASVLLAVLVDRGGREVPIEANAIGARLELPSGDQIQLSGPDPLQLHLRTT